MKNKIRQLTNMFFDDLPYSAEAVKAKSKVENALAGYTREDAEKLMSVMTRAFYRAGAHIMKIYREDFTVKYKEDASPVTEADEGANKIILDILHEAYPSYATLAEESYKDDRTNRQRLENPWCFIVDPLDGTKEFVAHVDQFSICIALSHLGKIEAGAVYAPTCDLMYYAARGLGSYKVQTDGHTEPAFFNPKDRIHVSDRTENLVAMVSRSHIDEPTAALLKRGQEEGRIAKVISAGSALKGCAIAAGEADIYYRMGETMEWDTAANQVIIEEAGGIMRQLDKARSEFVYNREDSLNANGFYILNKAENDLADADFVISVR